MFKIALIVENSKELHDYIIVLNKLNCDIKIKLYIVYLAEIYQDLNQDILLKNINFEYKILNLKNLYDKSFKEYNLIEKIKLVQNNIKLIYNFIQNCNILLSGIQTVFERVLYCKIKKNKLPIKTIVYHRHLLFDDKVNTSSSKLIHNSVVYKLLSLLNLDGLLIEKKAVGFADQYMVLGEINQSYLIEKGINKEKIHKVGSIEYDNIEQFIIEKKYDLSTPNICYITSACEWIGDHEGESYQRSKILNFLEYCKKAKYKKVTIRLHPREDYKKYEILKTNYSFLDLQYPSNNNILQDLSIFDVIIGGFSTVLFEVMLINKRVLFYSLDEEKYRYEDLIEKFDLDVITNVNHFSKIHEDGAYKKNNFIEYSSVTKSLDKIVKVIKKELNV